MIEPTLQTKILNKPIKMKIKTVLFLSRFTYLFVSDLNIYNLAWVANYERVNILVPSKFNITYDFSQLLYRS